MEEIFFHTNMLYIEGVMSRILKISFVLVVLTVLISGLLEGAARIWGPQLLPPDKSRDVAHGESLPGEPNMIGDAQLGWRVKEGDNRQFGVPEMTHVNSRGLRNSEIPIVPELEKRILIVGDSSIYGVRVRDRENISGQLQRILRKEDENWEVLNGGCPGYSSWQVKHLLADRLLDYQPEWLIIGALWSDTQGADAPDATRYGEQPMAWKFHSRLYMVSQAWYNRWKYTSDEAPHVGFGLGPVMAPTNRVPISDYKKNLHEIVKMASDRDIKVAFLMLPGVHDIIDGTTGDFREGYRVAMKGIASHYDAPIAEMPTFFEGGEARQLFFDDVHPKVNGYRTIAQELHRVMFEKD